MGPILTLRDPIAQPMRNDAKLGRENCQGERALLKRGG